MPQSSAEAETAIYAIAAKDLMYVINVLADLRVNVRMPVPIHCDNQAAIAAIRNPSVTARNRHYERWMLYGREEYMRKISTPVYISTKEQVGDIFTKALDKTTFLKFRAILLNLSDDSLAALVYSYFY